MSEQALEQHKQFLQLILKDVMEVLASGKPNVQRLIRALDAYWESSLSHRAQRQAAEAAVAGTKDALEPLGRPFRMMLQAELAPTRGEKAEALAQMVYDEARMIALDEATTGEREAARRYAVIMKVVR